jgi:hypothetical protein
MKRARRWGRLTTVLSPPVPGNRWRDGYRHANRVLLDWRCDGRHEYGQSDGLQDHGDRHPAEVARGRAVHLMPITAHL